MAIIVVGGHSRNVGKTSVVAGLIAALPEFHWTALKITQYGHGVCSSDGGPCHCATSDHTWAMSEEKDALGGTDTSRFLAAGAERVFWVRAQQGRLAEAMPAIRRRISGLGNIILESNSVLKFLRPDLYLTVLDPATPDFKISAREFLDRASALLVHQPADGKECLPAVWKDVSLKLAAEKPVFRICPPLYVTPEIVDFVRKELLELGS